MLNSMAVFSNQTLHGTVVCLFSNSMNKDKANFVLPEFKVHISDNSRGIVGQTIKPKYDFEYLSIPNLSICEWRGTKCDTSAM